MLWTLLVIFSDSTGVQNNYIYIYVIYILQAFQLPVYQIRPKSILFVFCCYTNN